MSMERTTGRYINVVSGKAFIICNDTSNMMLYSTKMYSRSDQRNSHEKRCLKDKFQDAEV